MHGSEEGSGPGQVGDFSPGFWLRSWGFGLLLSYCSGSLLGFSSSAWSKEWHLYLNSALTPGWEEGKKGEQPVSWIHLTAGCHVPCGNSGVRVEVRIREGKDSCWGENSHYCWGELNQVTALDRMSETSYSVTFYKVGKFCHISTKWISS